MREPRTPRTHGRIPSREVAERREVRSAVLRFLLAGLLALFLVATPVALWVRAEAERHALTKARAINQRLADNVVAPLITDELLAGDPESLQRLDRRLAPWLSSRTLSRIKVWDRDGRIVYSDMESLVGQQFEHPEWARMLLEGGPGTAALEHQTSEENEFEASSGELLEVYVRSMSQSGSPMIFETYSSGKPVRAEQHAVLMGMIPPIMLSLGALQVAQFVPAVRLARRIQVHQATRNALLRCAIEASDHERRQIAGELHDEIIQDLSGLAYALESEERRGTSELRPVFSHARTMLQHDVRKLRAMTSELYPPDLEELGLRASLLQLESLPVQRGIAYSIDVPDTLALDREQAALIYRVAREALVNATKHSSAQSVRIRVHQSAQHTAITVVDDGVGFTPRDTGSENHFGLRILGDTIRQAGGSFRITSAPGQGTSVAASFRAPATTMRRSDGRATSRRRRTPSK